MNIQQAVNERLKQFISQPPQAKEVELLTRETQSAYLLGVTAEGGITASLTIADFDRFSLSVKQVEVICPRRKETFADLDDYAQNLVKRLNYLSEPLALMEIDQTKETAQLRSQSPQQDEDGLAYWEAMIYLCPNPYVSLARYQWNTAQTKRSQLDYPVTFNTMGRIIADMVASLSLDSDL